MAGIGPFTLKAEAGVADLVTAISLAAILMAALYNLGFFLPIEWSYVSLLSISDLLFGTLFFAPIATVAFLVIWFFDNISSPSSVPTGVPKAKKGIGLTTYALGFFILIYNIYVYFFFQELDPFVLYIDIYMVLATAIILIARDRRHMWLSLLGLSVLYGPIGAGIASVEIFAWGNSKPDARVVLEDSTLDGHVLRATSNYLFVKTADAVAAIPTSEIKMVTTYDTREAKH